MLINEEYIREFTEKNLWQLDKADVQSLASSLDIEWLCFKIVLKLA